jgi:hypothetical protein
MEVRGSVRRNQGCDMMLSSGNNVAGPAADAPCFRNR